MGANFGGVYVAIAGRHCWGAIAGPHYSVPLLGAIAGCHGRPLLDAIVGVPLLAGCHCWLPWVPIGGAPLLAAMGAHCWGPLWGCHCEKKLTRALHRSPLHLSLH